jgi:hypothetical protein
VVTGPLDGVESGARNRAPPRVDADLGLAVGDVGANDLVGDVAHVAFVDQPVVDPLDGVPLLAGRVQVRAEDFVDDRL